MRAFENFDLNLGFWIFCVFGMQAKKCIKLQIAENGFMILRNKCKSSVVNLLIIQALFLRG